MGREEQTIITPALNQLRAERLEVAGPLPADTAFHEEARANYDAILCMYHDQALIPVKTLDFHGGVNVTLGLPFIRTSPDHGTALGIAGNRQSPCRKPDCGAHPGRRHGSPCQDSSTGEDGLPPLREVIDRHDLGAKKSSGQNFLFDLNLTRRIARSAAPLEGFTIVEVGPGPGGLTRALLMEGAKQVIAIERDERALAALAEIEAAYPGRLTVIAGDALAMDWAAP